MATRRKPPRKPAARKRRRPTPRRSIQPPGFRLEVRDLEELPADMRAATPRWNPEPEDVQRSVVKLVLTLVEFLRKIMERQAVRRMDERTLTPQEVEQMGRALMTLEQTVVALARQFDLNPDDLNLDLGPLGRLS